ncbi:MAG: Cobyrinic acid ac-diamide synthase [Candidatus Gottesmanbacteria bacterium GW2011_GWC2_39_8]|uniref:Cobyrinic acid ac-diamide synthase n=1 Tax=Candidatus Gottesmanbacteria bacterium GW2011_GWC2_39_8 TaxID=1618450 RepID=A0A0G0PYL4_9BACT|nr:MAG: Cobyrinic acid ac-diamide synthase [Candidatus Gottesmanbacteria bacterium GW2011_GWC2_39_8]
MTKIIAIVNQKGGVGKTTTSINLSASLASLGKNTLLIDMDPQANSTSGFGLNNSSEGKSLYRAILGEYLLSETLRDYEISGLKIIPSNSELYGAEIELIDVTSRELLLKNSLPSVIDNFNYIIVDCPPSLGILTINALCAATSVIVPLQCEYYALEGIAQILETIKRIRRGFNPALEIEGILLTMFDSRTNLSSEVTENVMGKFGAKVFKTIIPRNVRLSEAPSFGKPIILYDKHSRGALSYQQLAEEIIENDKKISG